MEYKKCYFYGLKSKKRLLEILHIDRKVYSKNTFINCKITPYIIEQDNKKKRLIEAPDDDLKAIQSRIMRALQQIDVPNYAFSGVKGKCYIDNAKVHTNKKHLFQIDISKFFPNTSRDKVYRFYRYCLNTSPDVANILTNFSTINLDLKNQLSKNIQEVNDYIGASGIQQRNHLITGSPISSIMSYFANIDLFEDMYNYSKKFNIDMSVYVDDVVFSTNNKIPSFFKKEIIEIIKRKGYNVSSKKCKWYDKPAVKKVTGVIIDEKGNMQVPNKLMFKTHKYIDEVKNSNLTNIERLRGCVEVASSINGKFSSYKKQICNLKKVDNSNNKDKSGS